MEVVEDGGGDTPGEEEEGSHDGGDIPGDRDGVTVIEVTGLEEDTAWGSFSSYKCLFIEDLLHFRSVFSLPFSFDFSEKLRRCVK